MQKKRILFVINTMGRAGAERALIALLKTLSPEQYDITLLSLINRGELFSEIPAHVTVQNKKPSCGSVLSAGGRLALIAAVLRCFFYRLCGFRLLGYLCRNFAAQKRQGAIQMDKLLWRVIAFGTPAPEEEYDAAIAYLEGGSTYYVAHRVRAKKKAAFVHIDYKNAGYSPLLDEGCYEQIDRIFCVSQEAKKSFLQLYPEQHDKVFLFRNLLDAAQIRQKSLLPIKDDDLFVKSRASVKLLTVGRLHPQKAYDVAIAALALLRRNGIDADWFVLGDGPLRAALNRQIADASLSRHFILLGSRENPYPYYRQATIYVHATRFEGKSIAIEEAQLLGKAIVASDCTGNREQITDRQNGSLVSLKPAAIADAIAELVRNTALLAQYEKASQNVDLQHPEDRAHLEELFE